MLLEIVLVYCTNCYFFFYLSLDQGIFPNDLKNARVTLIFKTGSEDKIDNYRPA